MKNKASQGEIVEERDDEKKKEKENDDDPLAPVRNEEIIPLEKEVVDNASLEETQASKTIDQEKLTHHDSRKNTDLKDGEIDENDEGGRGTAQADLQELNRTEIHTFELAQQQSQTHSSNA